jgi:hypothetical protein
MLTPQTLADVIQRCDEITTHAWMVRTFVKHSEEVEDYPELEGLMGLARTVFDACRALETRIDDPSGYLKMLRKKIGRLKKAIPPFETDALSCSTHTNWVLAIRSIKACVRDLEELLELGTEFERAAGSSLSENISEPPPGEA